MTEKELGGVLGRRVKGLVRIVQEESRKQGERVISLVEDYTHTNAQGRSTHVQHAFNPFHVILSRAGAVSAGGRGNLPPWQKV